MEGKVGVRQTGHAREVCAWWIGTGLPVLLIAGSLMVFLGAWGVPRVVRHLPPKIRQAGEEVARRFRTLPGRLGTSAPPSETAEEAEEGLTPRQQEVLRRFQACEEEIEARRAALLRENAERSPYLAAAVAATRAYRREAAAFEKLVAAPQMPSEDERRAKTYEISRLREAARQANGKHRAWKAAHVGDLKTLEEDETYRRLRTEQRACAALLPPGLVEMPARPPAP